MHLTHLSRLPYCWPSKVGLWLAMIATTTVLAAAPVATPPATTQSVAVTTPTGYRMATQPRTWSFPRDHGRHDGFKTEWWYFSGNLADGTGRPFGFQLTFFRVSASPINVPPDSPLCVGDIYFAHAAVSDLSGRHFDFKDIMMPKPTTVPASETDTLAVALDGWSAKLLPGVSATPKLALEASNADLGIHLTCLPREPVLQGPDGISRKGEKPEQASYYYSMIRMPTTGTIQVADQTFHVSGLTWMDHEFSSNALGPEQVGWDWFGLSLKDGKNLMVYRLRNKASESAYISGTLIDLAGHATYLDAKQLEVAGSDPWKSESGAAYPQTWSLHAAGLPALTIKSRLPDQELRTARTTRINYFEGACGVFDAAGEAIGEGYMEMTGYDKPMNPF